MINFFVSKILTVSEDTKKTVIRDEKVSPQKITVVQNGVDLQARQGDAPSCSRKDFGIPSYSIIVTIVANLSPIKGHIYLLDAATLVMKNCSHCHFLLVGDGDLRVSLQERATKLGVSDNVHFLGKRSDVPALLDISDICVLPSLSEGMSNAILEYMATSKPVIATRVGGNPELVDDGVTGILVNKEDPLQLAGAIIALINDPTKRKEMGSRGLARIQQQFSMDIMINRYEELFRGCTKGYI